MGPSEGERPDPEGGQQEAAGRRLVRLAMLVYSAMAAVAVLWRVVIQGEPIFFTSVFSLASLSWLWRMCGWR